MSLTLVGLCMFDNEDEAHRNHLRGGKDPPQDDTMDLFPESSEQQDHQDAKSHVN